MSGVFRVPTSHERIQVTALSAIGHQCRITVRTRAYKTKQAVSIVIASATRVLRRSGSRVATVSGAFSIGSDGKRKAATTQTGCASWVFKFVGGPFGPPIAVSSFLFHK